MKLADATALSAVGNDHQQVFISRAGFAVAHAARTMLGGSYGKQVIVIAGPGHNGEDGRVAAYWLTQWGAAVEIAEGFEFASINALPEESLYTFNEVLFDPVSDNILPTALVVPLIIPTISNAVEGLLVPIPTLLPLT
jgi:hypothetical protein